MDGEFTPYMQRCLIQLCVLDRSTRATVEMLNGINQLRFTDPTAAWGWMTLTRLQRATFDQLRNEAHKLEPTNPATAGLFDLFKEPVHADLEYVRAHIVTFAQMQTFRIAFDESSELWNTGKRGDAIDQMKRRLEEIRKLDTTGTREESWFVEEFSDRVFDRQLAQLGSSFEQVPTGIEAFDDALGGGARRGCTHAWLAYSGVGKTMALVDQGVGALRLRLKVAHFNLEGRISYVTERYDAVFTRLKTGAVRKGEIDADAYERVMRELAMYRRNCYLRGTSDLRANPDIGWFYGELDRLKDDENFIPDVLIIDYGDEIRVDKQSDVRLSQIEAWQGLHKLGEYKISPSTHPGWVLWSATQAVRPDKGADEREHWLYARDIGEAWGKVKPVEFLASINRTLDEKMTNQARVMICKNRHGAEGVRVRVQTDYGSGGFLDPMGQQEVLLAS